MAEIIATGNLADDAQLRYTTNGSPVLNFRIGDSKSKKNGDQWETIAQNWFNVSVWGSLAEFYADKLTKGTRVKITGEFYQREYDKKDGTGKGVSLDVNAWGVHVIPKRDNNNGGGFSNQQASQQQSAPSQSQNQSWQSPAPGHDPWSSNANANGGWGNPQQSEAPF
ncbi:single-stranded DNA-binding protein [Glutamicibacter sp. FR1]|uniref:single-stranded DNA-binding protein n=1 Tax=Glutamicibacter sp. FR1 TaxID=3393744 RepID=UPI0039AF85B0